MGDADAELTALCSSLGYFRSAKALVASSAITSEEILISVGRKREDWAGRSLKVLRSLVEINERKIKRED